MQILGNFKVFKYYLNSHIYAKYLNSKFKVFKYCQITRQNFYTKNYLLFSQFRTKTLQNSKRLNYNKLLLLPTVGRKAIYDAKSLLIVMYHSLKNTNFASKV